MSQKALVADDSGVMRNIIIRSLNAVGITDVQQAEDGAVAIDKFEKGSFDVVLTDWNMPNKSGLDVLKAIREKGSKVPVIMVTTESESSRVMEAVNEGVTDFLVKPFQADLLKAKLDKYL